jgi:hypothetical protein
MKDINLQNIPLPEIHLTHHKRILKEALITSFEPKKQLSIMHLFAKGGEYWTMQRRLITFSFGAIAVLGIFLSLAFIKNPFKSSYVQAQEVMDKVIFTLKDLTPEQRKEIETKIKADLESSLEETKAAKDLRVISAEEFMKMEKKTSTDVKGKKGFFFAVKEDEEGNNALQKKVRQIKENPLSPKDLTLLRYTDTKGRDVTLGIDKNNIPVMKLMKIENLDSKDMMDIPEELRQLTPQTNQ